MKIFGKYLLMSAIALGLWSCSDDAPEVNSPDDPVDELYMSVRIQLPTSGGSRSTTTGDNTSTGGTEIGKDYENKVSKLLLVLAEPTTHKFVSHKIINNPTQNGSTVSAKGTFTKSVLINYLDNAENTDIELFVFCNYTTELENYFKSLDPEGEAAKSWFNNLTHTVNKKAYSWTDQNSNESIWAENSFLMANCSVATGYLPAKSDINAGNYNSASTPWSLTGTGSVTVQRSVARFDFKDGTREFHDAASRAANTYDFAKNSTDDITLQITLTHMSLVNLSKSFYHLIRTSKDGKNEATKLCGADNKIDWVVDTDASEKIKGQTIPSNNFFYWTDKAKWAPSEWDTYEISDILNNQKYPPHNFEGWTAGKDGKYDGYKIWRYVTENTIPSMPRNQINGISTGVIFQGSLKCTDAADAATKTAMNTNHEPVYAFDGKFYGSWASVGEFVTKNVSEPAYNELIAAYNSCSTTGTEADKEKDRVSKGFAIYRYDPATNGYPMHFYYWNRHDDNGEPAVMGHMEFQVVRNNIYKLKVTKISGLGHPTKPGDDPDPFDPEDPDEEENVYFSVAVSMVPWVVRVNDITFP